MERKRKVSSGKVLKRKKIERLMRLVWSSLESHLYYCHKPSSEGRAFHVRCVEDYAEQLKLLSELMR